LELILADESSSTSSLLDAIRDLAELVELLEEDEDEDEYSPNEINLPSTPRSRGHTSTSKKPGAFTINRRVICVRDYPPALGCMLLQTTHFSSLVEKAIADADTSTERLFQEEEVDDSAIEAKQEGSDKVNSFMTEDLSTSPSRDKRWKYETLDTRVSATTRAVVLAKNWLPRLIQIGLVTQEAEKRLAARQIRKSDSSRDSDNEEDNILSASGIFNTVGIDFLIA